MHLRPHACDELVTETTTICPWGRGLAASALLLPLLTNVREQEFSEVRLYSVLGSSLLARRDSLKKFV